MPPPCLAMSRLGHVSRPGSSFVWGVTIPAPDQVAGLRTARVEIRRLIEIVAARPDDQAILDHDRRDRPEVHHLERAEFLEPLLRARS